MPIGKYKRPTRTAFIPVGPSIGYVPLTRGLFALVDSEDAAYLSQWNWYASGKNYAVRHIPKIGGGLHTLGMHRVVLGRMGELRDEQFGDHRGGDTLDNRRCALRIATKQENLWNRAVRAKSISGLKGVTLEKRTKRWRARIMVNGKAENLGLHGTKEEAYAAYCSASTKCFGEFSRIA